MPLEGGGEGVLEMLATLSWGLLGWTLISGMPPCLGITIHNRPAVDLLSEM